MVGILAYIYEEQVETELNLHLNATFLDNYMIDEDKTKAIDDMQTEVNRDFVFFFFNELFFF